MSGLIDKGVGIYHFIADRPPKSIPLVAPKPRAVNPWCSDGQPRVAKVTAGEDIRGSVDRVMALLGPLEKAIDRGDNVLVKPNFNSPDPPPGSTDLAFLRAVVELLLDAGAKVTIGESAGGMWRPTRNVLRKLAVLESVRDLNVELVAFDEKTVDWVKVKVDGDYLDSVSMPRRAYEADKIVYLPCLKTHKLARFTGALKLAVGFMHPGERRALHARNLEEKAAEISLCWQPNLIIMDGRKVFVTRGPDKGQLVEPGLLLASGDLVAADVEAMRLLLAYGARNKLVADPWQNLQVVTALKHGLGPRDKQYVVVE